MNLYKKKRYKVGVSKSDMANYLGVSYERYNLIEKGLVKMPKNLIDKFNEIINKNKGELKLDKLQNNEDVSKWFEEMTKIGENGIRNINNKMMEFNIYTQVELSQLLGYGTPTIAQYFKHPSRASYDFKNALYTFFNNELNIQPKKDKKIKTNNDNYDLYSWWNNFNLVDFMEKYEINTAQLRKQLGVSDGTAWNIKHKTYTTPNPLILSKLKSYVDDVISNNATIDSNIEESIKDNTSSPIENKAHIIYVDTIDTSIEESDTMRSKISKKCEEYIVKIELMKKSKKEWEDIIIRSQNSINEIADKIATYEMFLDELKNLESDD